MAGAAKREYKNSFVRGKDDDPDEPQELTRRLVAAVILGFVGANPPAGTWLVIGRLATAYYFIHFLVILPLVGWFERPKPLPESISTPVLGDAGGGAATPEPAE